MKVVLAPLLRAGYGTGHLRRCLLLADKLGQRAVFAVGLDREEPLREELAARPVVRAGTPVAERALVVADRFRTDLETYRLLRAWGPVVGIDEGGPARRWMACLLDTLPGARGAANVSSVGLLDLPPRRRSAPVERFERVLVSFGGEDALGLTRPFVELLVRSSLFAPHRITVVQGPRFRETRWPAGVNVLSAPPRLAEVLHEYDLVFTQFGLTCFEALAAGVPVLLLSPRRVHRRLARRAGLPEIGLRRARHGALVRALSQPQALARSVELFHAGLQRPPGGLPALVSRLEPARDSCPLCGAARGTPPRALARFPDRTYFRCPSCGLIYMVRLLGEETRYDHRYFFEDYARQYGRTYLEDFGAIRAVSLARLAEIRRLLGPLQGLRVLDVGCAYGPFLDAARGQGAQASGVEPSAEAAAYVRERLGIPCAGMRFEDYEAEPRSVEVLSMWYVVEHLADLAPVLRKANRLLAKGGLLAVSTPNARGISGRRDLVRFLEASPADHYTIWDPRCARRVLGRFGFRVARVRVTGHHPERFPAAGHLAVQPQAAGARLALAALGVASRILGLGDTFEAYAIKTRDLDG